MPAAPGARVLRKLCRADSFGSSSEEDFEPVAPAEAADCSGLPSPIPSPPGYDADTDQCGSRPAAAEHDAQGGSARASPVPMGCVDYGDWGAVQQWRPQVRGAARRSRSHGQQCCTGSTAQRGNRGRLVLDSASSPASNSAGGGMVIL
eukprot:TRINITY_DN28436_c0_g1_i1.p2 TRINITY_DN28436_c0_g1~~TRINITY_DN28436_c0_g1_i1.p2  ORF type:complete len:148 (+),score=20.79 TRINITY_DN28436_c0_g1_i1:65-508(+)